MDIVFVIVLAVWLMLAGIITLNSLTVVASMCLAAAAVGYILFIGVGK